MRRVKSLQDVVVVVPSVRERASTSTVGVTSPLTRIQRIGSLSGRDDDNGATPSSESPAIKKDNNNSNNSTTTPTPTVHTATEAPHSSLLLLHLRYIPFSDESPLRVNPTSAIKRAISVLDYFTPVGTHKVGIVYVGPRQTQEEQILGNSFGSLAYTKFLRSLGHMVRLKGFKGFTGGLDTDTDKDGPLSIHLQTEMVELMFHVATLMPSETADAYLQKKRHVGNCNVLVVWNEGEGEFSPSVLRGDLSFVQIIITPVGESSARVHIYRKRDLGGAGLLLPNHIIQLDVLAPLLVQTALDSDEEICNVMGYKLQSGAAARLDQIKKVRKLWQQQLQEEEQQMTHKASK